MVSLNGVRNRKEIIKISFLISQDRLVYERALKSEARGQWWLCPSQERKTSPHKLICDVTKNGTNGITKYSSLVDYNEQVRVILCSVVPRCSRKPDLPF